LSERIWRLVSSAGCGSSGEAVQQGHGDLSDGVYSMYYFHNTHKSSRLPSWCAIIKSIDGPLTNRSSYVGQEKASKSDMQFTNSRLSTKKCLLKHPLE
jgi:hypothetical protein